MIIKQYLGIELLKYSLNYTQDIKWDTPFSELVFTKDQSQAVDILYNLITQARIDFVRQDGFGDGFDHYLYGYQNNNKNIFNCCRMLCKGVFPDLSNDSEDLLLLFILNLAIREYPNFLIKSSKRKISYSVNPRVLKNIQQYEEFVTLVKKDVLNNLTNKKDGLDYCFSFETTNKLKFFNQVSIACETIISRSFESCCKKMKYGIDDFLKEIKVSLSSLRDLAQGKEAIFSVFMGVQGVICQDLDVIELSDCILRAIDRQSNPGAHLTFSMHNDAQDRYVSGAVIEIKYPIKAILFEHQFNCTHTFSKELSEHVENCFENLRFSLCFSLEEDYAFSMNFQENGFPLVNPGNCVFGNSLPRKHVKIKKSNVEDFKDWYQRLSGVNKENIKIVLKRLNYAIHERANAEDSIIDAVTAWEAIFSGSYETTFKVTASIAKFLKPICERKAFLKRLKDLYKVRSDIVHGNKPGLFKRESMDSVRSDVVKIGLECLKKLIDTPTLLQMSPGERVESILILA